MQSIVQQFEPTILKKCIRETFANFRFEKIRNSREDRSVEPLTINVRFCNLEPSQTIPYNVKKKKKKRRKLFAAQIL